MEKVSGPFKTECIRTTVSHHSLYQGIADVDFATAGWVDWQNNRRLHSSPNSRTPADFEHAHYAAPNRELQPA